MSSYKTGDLIRVCICVSSALVCAHGLSRTRRVPHVGNPLILMEMGAKQEARSRVGVWRTTLAQLEPPQTPDHISTNTITSSTLMVRVLDTWPKTDGLCFTAKIKNPCICLTGSRIASWLPSFSVEVMHTTNILGIAQANNSQLMAMVSSSLPSNEICL